MDRYIIIGIILLMLLLLVIHANGSNMNIMEKFEDKPQLPNLQSCPADLTQYTTDISINCCDGDVAGSRCNGTPKCTLSNSSGNLPRCIDYLAEYINDQSKKHCTASLKNYYEPKNPGKGMKGICTSSRVSNNYTSQDDITAPKCVVYRSPELNESSSDSCYNQKLMENMIVPSGAQKHLWRPSKDVVLFYATYQDELKMMSCYDRKTLYDYLDKMVPSWRSNKYYVRYIEDSILYCEKEKARLDARAKDPFYKSPVPPGLTPR